MTFPTEWKNNKCSKPPTKWGTTYLFRVSPNMEKPMGNMMRNDFSKLLTNIGINTNGKTCAFTLRWILNFIRGTCFVFTQTYSEIKSHHSEIRATRRIACPNFPKYDLRFIDSYSYLQLEKDDFTWNLMLVPSFIDVYSSYDYPLLCKIGYGSKLGYGWHRNLIKFDHCQSCLGLN